MRCLFVGGNGYFEFEYHKIAPSTNKLKYDNLVPFHGGLHSVASAGTVWCVADGRASYPSPPPFVWPSAPSRGMKAQAVVQLGGYK